MSHSHEDSALDTFLLMVDAELREIPSFERESG
jgi:hypothetical protein